MLKMTFNFTYRTFQVHDRWLFHLYLNSADLCLNMNTTKFAENNNASQSLIFNLNVLESCKYFNSSIEASNVPGCLKQSQNTGKDRFPIFMSRLCYDDVSNPRTHLSTKICWMHYKIKLMSFEYFLQLTWPRQLKVYQLLNPCWGPNNCHRQIS